MLTVFLTIIHVIVSLFLVIVVLLQSGKAADLAGAFGGMGSQTAFGPRGSATVLSKATAVGAALFMVTSLWLSVLATRSAGDRIGSSVLDSQPKKTQPSQPAKAPATPSPAPQGSHPVPVQTTPATPAK